MEPIPKDPMELPPLMITDLKEDTTIDWVLKRLTDRSWNDKKEWKSPSPETIYDIWLPCDVIAYKQVGP